MAVKNRIELKLMDSDVESLLKAMEAIPAGPPDRFGYNVIEDLRRALKSVASIKTGICHGEVKHPNFSIPDGIIPITDEEEAALQGKGGRWPDFLK